jgi:hypothetical protein
MRGHGGNQRPNAKQGTPRNRRRDARQPALVLTGMMWRRRFLASLYGRVLELPAIQYHALCTLVHALLTEETHAAAADAVTIHRLRRAIGRYIGSDAGESLIATAGQLYLLVLDAQWIAVDPSFSGPTIRSLLAEPIVDAIRARCPQVHCRLKSVRNRIEIELQL